VTVVIKGQSIRTHDSPNKPSHVLCFKSPSFSSRASHFSLTLSMSLENKSVSTRHHTGRRRWIPFCKSPELLSREHHFTCSRSSFEDTLIVNGIKHLLIINRLHKNLSNLSREGKERMFYQQFRCSIVYCRLTTKTKMSAFSHAADPILLGGEKSRQKSSSKLYSTRWSIISQ
jgi:hypothetical protein